MKYQELKELAEQGRLKVERTLYREHTRTRYTWNKDYTECTSKPVKYKIYTYSARTPDMKDCEFYRIRKAHYLELSKIIQEVSV